MNVPFMDLKTQYRTIASEINTRIANVVENADFILGEDLTLFEEEFARYCNTRFAVGLDNGTSALELALRAYGIGPGDEVITAANTFIATVSAIAFTGAKPVLVDIEPQTYNVAVSDIEPLITPHTRAIIPVHLYGQSANMEPIMELAKRYGLVIIEDACQAHGALYKGSKVGSIGHIGCFSFYPAKNLGAFGDGGMLVTNDPEIADRVRMLRNYGQQQKYKHLFIAYNRRLDTLQAAVLRTKLKFLDTWNNARRRHASLYNELLSTSHLVLPLETEYTHHVYHLYVVRTAERDALQTFLKDRGVTTGIHYPIPVHKQQAYQYLGYRQGDFPNSEAYAEQILSLPMFPELTEKQIRYVTKTISEFGRCKGKAA